MGNAKIAILLHKAYWHELCITSPVSLKRQAMKRIFALVIVALPILAYSQLFGQRTPGWVKNPPKSGGSVYAVGEGSSSTPDVAERKARLNASVALAKQVEPTIETQTTRLQSVVRNNKVLKERVQVIRESVVATLHDTRVIEKHTAERNGTHTVYLLVEMPKKNISQSFVDQIKNDKELYQAVAKSKAYKELLASAQ